MYNILYCKIISEIFLHNLNVFKRLFNRNIMSKEKEGSDVTCVMHPE